MTRDRKMRSRSCWAFAALALSAAGWCAPAGQASVTSGNCPTGKAQVTLAEVNCRDGQADKLDTSFRADENVVSVGTIQCNAISSGAPTPSAADYGNEMKGFETVLVAADERDANDLEKWGKGLVHRDSSYLRAGQSIYSGAYLMWSGLDDLKVAFRELSILVCDQTSNLAKAESDERDGYSKGVLGGLAALRKLIH